jgi:TonB family protein
LIDRALQIDPKDTRATLALSTLYVRALTAGGPLAERVKRDLESTASVQLLRLVTLQLRALPGEPLAALVERLKERQQQLDPSAPPPPPPAPPQPGVAGGVAGGVPGGVSGGVPGGVAGGVPGGVPGGGGARRSFSSSVPRTEGVERIRVGGNVQAAKLARMVRPEYPPLARQARIQGVVKFEVILAPDGSLMNAFVLAGHPLLVPAAQEAVRQWQWQPTLLNGTPVEIVTTVDVDFNLGAEI